MRVLAFDCATVSCSVALWEDGSLRAHETADPAPSATQTLVPMLARVMARAQLGFRDLDRLGVTVGPGHFTGLRAGLAVARGLQVACALPVVAVTTLEAVAAAVDRAQCRGRRVIVALDSKRSEPYFQVFDSGLNPIGPPCVMAVDVFEATLERGPLLVIGDAASALMAVLERSGRAAESLAEPRCPNAATVAAIAATRAALAEPVQPLYLHPPAARPLPVPEPSP